MPIDLSSKFSYIKKIKIFENDNYFYFIGIHNIDKTLHLLSFKKIKFDNENKTLSFSFVLKDIINHKEKVFPKTSLQDVIEQLQKVTHQKLRFISDSYGCFGFVKFFLGYYAILITEITKVGKIGRHIINRVEKVNVYPLFSVHNSLFQDPLYNLENKYLSLFKNFDFSRQIFFSYSYDMTKTLQRNFVEKVKQDIVPNYSNTYSSSEKNSNDNKSNLKMISNNNFLWNDYHLKEFASVLDSPNLWLLFCIYGFFEQTECNIFGLRLLVTVIARRNRHFAGTRYLKRGINNDGNVANDVETEQILEEKSTTWSDQPMISSFIHIRGSVPIYWYQEHNSLLPKPNIKVNLTDIRFDATKRHFALLTERYGHPCIVCNLTKKKEVHKRQETLLNFWYYEAIDYINSTCLNDKQKIIYHHYDLQTERLQPKFYKMFYDQSCKFIERTNIFCFIPKFKDNNEYHLSLQNGVIRSNCVDCVDRTNVYQQVIGLAVLVIQLRQMGVKAEFPEKENEEIYGVITDTYIRMGHELSTQYSGSLAHKQFIKDNRNSINKLFDKCSEIFNTFKRYFNNSFNDQHKQATINLFLGKYQVNSGLPNIWDMLNDTILHRKDTMRQFENDWFDKSYKRYELRNLLTDCENNNNGLIEFIDKNVSVSYSEILNKDRITHEKLESSKSIVSNSKVSSTKTLSNISSFTQKEIKRDLFSNNDYIISFDKYKKYKIEHKEMFIEEIQFQKDLNNYCMLYVEEKLPIKNFYNFSFSQILSIHTPVIYSLRRVASSTQLLKVSNTEITKIKIPSPSYYNIKHFTTERNLYSSIRNHSLRKTKKKLFQSTNNTKQFTTPYFSSFEKQRYNLKLSSFYPDSNDLNKINTFLHFNMNDNKNSIYSSIDPFLATNLSMSNYSDIFESYTFDLDIDHYPSNTKNNNHLLDVSADITNLFNNCSNIKNQNQKEEQDDNSDYFIYMVDEKCLYKKINTSIHSRHHMHHYSGESMTTLNHQSLHKRRNNSHENTFFYSSSKISLINTEGRRSLDVDKEYNQQPNWSERDLSPKAKVNMKFLPINILDNYYDMV